MTKPKTIKAWIVVSENGKIRNDISNFRTFSLTKFAKDWAWMLKKGDKILPCEIKLLDKKPKKK